MTLEEVRNELKTIRLYYSDKKRFDEAFKLLPHRAERLAKLYAEAISGAPLDLYRIYYKLHVCGLTQEVCAEEMGFSTEYIRSKNRQLTEYLKERVQTRGKE